MTDQTNEGDGQPDPGMPRDDDTMPVLPSDAPRYLCHKVVRAIQLSSVEQDPMDAGSVIVKDPHHAHPIRLRGAILARYTPSAGDYLVEYEDGYVAISPREAFEKGYALIEE